MENLGNDQVVNDIAKLQLSTDRPRGKAFLGVPQDRIGRGTVAAGAIHDDLPVQVHVGKVWPFTDHGVMKFQQLAASHCRQVPLAPCREGCHEIVRVGWRSLTRVHRR